MMSNDNPADDQLKRELKGKVINFCPHSRLCVCLSGCWPLGCSLRVRLRSYRTSLRFVQFPCDLLYILLRFTSPVRFAIGLSIRRSWRKRALVDKLMASVITSFSENKPQRGLSCRSHRRPSSRRRLIPVYNVPRQSNVGVRFTITYRTRTRIRLSQRIGG